MGCTQSSDKEEHLRSRKTDEELCADKSKQDLQVKLLLLGTLGSGKSTIAKQLKIIHLNGFTKEERMFYVSILRDNASYGIRTLLDVCTKQEIALGEREKLLVAKIMNAQSYEISREDADIIHELWKIPAIIEAYLSLQNVHHLNESTMYCLNHVKRFAASDFVPSVEDILFARARTIGISEMTFKIDGVAFRVLDVVGNRSERKKWIHCFEDGTTVIYCAAMSEYDQRLYEDNNICRLTESLSLFNEICNGPWFGNTPIILLVNKSDIFQEKIQRIPLSQHFPDYTGANEFTPAAEYIKSLFLNLNKNKDRKIYAHITCATETENIQFVFTSIRDSIVGQQQGLI